MTWATSGKVHTSWHVYAGDHPPIRDAVRSWGKERPPGFPKDPASAMGDFGLVTRQSLARSGLCLAPANSHNDPRSYDHGQSVQSSPVHFPKCNRSFGYHRPLQVWVKPESQHDLQDFLAYVLWHTYCDFAGQGTHPCNVILHMPWAQSKYPHSGY